MKRLWMSLGWILLTALLGCKSTESPPAAPVSDPSAVEPSDPATPETATQPLEGVRRERVGIDLGPATIDETEIDGRRPAARLTQPKKSSVPERLEGDKVQGAKAARAFVLGPWKSAVEQSDSAALLSLLDDPFTGLIAGLETAKPIPREAWPETRQGLGEPITLSDISIALVGSPKGDATVKFHERRGLGEACRTRTRELTLSIDPSDALRVRVASASAEVACGDQGASQVAAAHHQLMKLWQDEDRLEAASTTPSVWLRDFGLDVRTYDRASLHKGDGRWLLEALAGVDATEENTLRVGSVGQVLGPNGMVFSFHWTQERWTWQGVDRVR
jgi:hypothetical protein